MTTTPHVCRYGNGLPTDPQSPGAAFGPGGAQLPTEATR